VAGTLDAFKRSSFYQGCVRPCLWAPIWAHRSYRRFLRERRFDILARQDAALLARHRAHMERLYEHQHEPLVSITMATYNRAKLLLERTLPSVFAQTYSNIEIVIVGDHCTDETERLVGQAGDPRVRFHNLPRRPRYPSNPMKRWRIAGLQAINLACDMARGAWIAHLDDDDVFTPDHVEKLLQHALSFNVEFVSGRSRVELRPGQWEERGSALRKNGRIRQGYVSHSTVLRRSYTKFFRGDGCLKLDLAADSYTWARMLNAGVRTGFVDEVVTVLPLRPGELERSYVYSVTRPMS
jgi:Glycosyl transferase family 2